jgi:hypothetical protein
MKKPAQAALMASMIVLGALWTDVSSACTIVNGFPSQCVIVGGDPPATWGAPGEGTSALSSGLFIAAKQDLFVPGLVPIDLTRTYRSRAKDSSGS